MNEPKPGGLTECVCGHTRADHKADFACRYAHRFGPCRVYEPAPQDEKPVRG